MDRTSHNQNIIVLIYNKLHDCTVGLLLPGCITKFNFKLFGYSEIYSEILLTKESMGILHYLPEFLIRFNLKVFE